MTRIWGEAVLAECSLPSFPISLILSNQEEIQLFFRTHPSLSSSLQGLHPAFPSQHLQLEDGVIPCHLQDEHCGSQQSL